MVPSLMSLVPKAPVAPSQPAPVFNTPTRWVLRVLSWLAFLIAAYLAWGSITDTPIAGCGIGTHAGCDAVLNSPWAKWIVVPVSVAGLACYAGLAGLSVLLGIRDPRASRWITTAFVMWATVAAGASLWFIALQVFAIGEFCWYCLTTDACGIAIGALTSWSVSASKRSIAVRRALGASDGQILSWYIAQWARIVVPGLVGGWILQWLWTSALVAAIQGLHATTPVVLMFATGLMVVAAASAATVPLRRALAADSATLMR